ncbi:MAG TPA: rhamnogalacturonan lyase B N-terminal domain-containing protein [Lacunisphaera sp.]|jgi:rhamnogalacturonan endolyase
MNCLHAPIQRFFVAAKAAVVRRLVLMLGLLFAPALSFASFGYVDNGATYGVDTGAGLVFQVRKTDGSITSIVFNGTEYNGPSGKGSQIASGLGSPTTVTPESDGSTYVKITVQTDATNGVVAGLTQYLVVRNGENRIYMATYTTAEPDVGELRWITRLDAALIPNGPAPSNNTGSTGAIESTDVFGYADGTSTSKYYGDNITHGKDRAMDLTYCGATGPGIGCWMVFGSRESSSGGPFFRDIQNQNGGDQEIYNYMNSGHNQTEPTRVDHVLHGPYVLDFTTGAPPTLPVDFSWMGDLGLNGWVPASGRGTVSGAATGVPAGFQGVVGFANATAQYWATVSGNAYTCTGMKPGTYTATLYKGELAVATDSVTVTAGATTTLDLASTETIPSTIFRIGEWDGTPAGFLNADKIVQMHPQDVRMSPWTTTTFTAGVDNPAVFPAIQFRAANSPTTIKFNLAPNQLVDLTVKIGLTCAYNSGRPQITVNSFTSAAPAASSQPSSRSFTIGTYRGNNALFTYTIPASALVAGTNTMTINPISGSTDLGTWLSAGWVYDAVELDGPIATPVITYAGSSPFIVSGTAEPGRNVTLTLDGTTVIGTTVAAGGIWSITYNSSLSAGSHSLTAVASDDSGHSSPASAPYVFNSGIVMPAITSALGDTGTYVNGATTSDRVFVFNGTAGAGDTVALTRIGVGVIGSVVANGSGNWSFDYTGNSLPDGANSFYATASNGGGTSGSSAIFTLNLQGVPRVTIVRFNPTSDTITTGVGGVVFRVTFNHPVSGATPGAFALTTTGTAGGSVASISGSSGTILDVTVNNLAGSGTLRLDLKPDSGIVDGSNNSEAGYTAGQVYTLVQPTTGNGTWIQPASGGLWSDAANWLNAVIADGAANSANLSTLDLTADNTVHLDSPRILSGITFGDTAVASPASWILDDNGSTANTLTLAGAAPTLTVNALGGSATATIGTSLAGTAGFSKAGAGTLVLTAANPITGTLNVNAGFLQLVPGGSLSLGNNPVNLAINTRINVTGGSFAAGGLTSAISSFVVDGGAANLGSFRTNADFGAALRVTSGTLTVGDVSVRRNSAAAADFTSGFIVSGTGVVTATTVGLGTQNSTGAMSIEGNGSLTVTGPVTIANQATSARGGAMRVIGGTFTSTDTALGIVLGRTNGTNANNVATATFTGGVSTVEKFTLGFDSTVTAGSSTITVNGGTLYIGSGGIVKNGAAGLATTLSLSSGTLGAKAPWSMALPITLPSGGNIALAAADASAAPFDIALNGVISGAGGFTKTGAGSLTLAGADTYTGATNVNAGTLNLTGSLSTAVSAVTINSGGTLAGTGAVSRPVMLNAGGTIAPAGTAIVGTISGASLDWNGGTLAVDLGATGTSDQLALSGALTKDAASGCTVAFAPASGFSVGNTYTLATFASTNFTAADFTATGLPAGTGALFIVNATSLQIQIQGSPSITSATNASGTFGTPFSYTIGSTETPVTFGATGLPAGLGIDPATGIISGTPGAAGTFSVTITATNSAGSDSKTLTLDIARAPASVFLGDLNAVYNGAPHSVSVVTAPPGVAVGVTYNGSVTPPTDAGTYAVIATVIDANYFGGASATLTIAKATATIELAPLTQRYDGTPKLVTATTTPADLDVSFTYDGVTAGPIYPGAHAVVATINDANYEGTKTDTLVITITALVRHAPVFNGIVDGSVQMLLPENLTLNGSASLSGDLLVPGTPALKLNGSPMLAGTKNGPGVATPTNYTVTLNGGAVVRYFVRRVDAIPLPAVAAPTAPTGTRTVSINNSGQSAGNFATLRNLTLNNGGGQVVVPPGAYGNFIANSGSFVLGVAGATEPAVYSLQNLTINGNVTLKIAGPVILTLANGVTFNGAAGNSAHPEWFTLQIYSGGVTLNGNGTLYGTIIAPNGTVTLNAALHGIVSSDRLILNGNALLDEPTP